MSAIGMYMTGNSLQIFSIMMVFMLFKTPITAIMNIQPTFARLETDGTRDKMWQVKVVYVLCNMLALALGIWKVNKMGLLPYVFLLNLSAMLGHVVLTNDIGQRDRIGWHGKRRENLWKEHIQCGRHDDASHLLSVVRQVHKFWLRKSATAIAQ